MKGVEVRIVDRWYEADIIGLYGAGGWWEHGSDPSSIEKIVKGSYVFAVAVDLEKGKAVGMGRAISDGVSDAYIQDVIVLPEYRRRQVGRKIIEAITEHLLKRKIEWIGLVAQSGTPRFYAKAGYKRMKGHTPMKYAGKKC